MTEAMMCEVSSLNEANPAMCDQSPQNQEKPQDTYQDRSRRVFDPPLALQRYTFIMKLLEKEIKVKSVTDLGSGNCRLMSLLKSIDHLRVCNFVDIDYNVLEYESHYNAQPLPWDFLFGRQGTLEELQVNVYHGDITNPDCRLMKSDVITMVEVIEHLEPHVLEKVPSTIFGIYKPSMVIITTPNREFNSLFFEDNPTKLRHWDHKFEWTRAEFEAWCKYVTSIYPDYFFELHGVGHLPNSQDLGPCTQIAVFQKLDMLNLSLTQTTKVTDVEMQSGEKHEASVVQTLSLHSRYTYPGQKVKPPEPDFEVIDWTLCS